MISILGRKWVEIKYNKNLIEKLKQDFNFSNVLSKLLISRNFDETELSTIKNDLKLTNVFSKNIDFQKSVELVYNSLNKREYICILGDYDVDGSAATSLLIRFFESIDHPFFYYIPDREKDGYGASKRLFEKLILKKPKLIIMVDCGSTSNQAINFLNENGIKSIIIDHHEINKPFPKANIIINPKKNNGYVEYDYLCATALVYFFLDLLSQKIKNKIKLTDYLIYVLLATVCDVMPLRKLNRLIAITALKSFDINKNKAFYEIFHLCNKKNRVNINDLGYLVGPIINAGGRLGKSSYASELLSSNDTKVIYKKSNELIILNNKRKEIEAITLSEIDFKKIEKENKDIIIYFNANIKEGLIGIIAARLKDYFNKPAIVITASKKSLKGSARSIYNYNIGRVIKNSLDQKLINTGGGHSMAAGFSLEKSKLNDFKDFIINDFSKSKPVLKKLFSYDSEISSIALNHTFLSEINKLGPFGVGNPNPVFLVRDLKVIKSYIHKGKHVSAILKSRSGPSINSISFNSINSRVGEHLLNYKKTFTVVGQINENISNNKKTIQLTIQDLII